MLVVESRAGLLNEIARALYSVGRASVSVVPAEPAPCWTDYLRDTRDRSA